MNKSLNEDNCQTIQFASCQLSDQKNESFENKDHELYIQSSNNNRETEQETNQITIQEFREENNSIQQEVHLQSKENYESIQEIQSQQKEQDNDNIENEKNYKDLTDFYLINNIDDLDKLSKNIEDCVHSLKESLFFHHKIIFKSKQFIFLQGCLGEKDNQIYIQMTIMEYPENLVLILDQSFTMNNICLQYNKELKIGSIFYCSETHQVIYEIKNLKREQANKIFIQHILNSAEQNFNRIFLQIQKLGFKIQCADISTMLNFYANTKKSEKTSKNQKNSYFLKISYTTGELMDQSFDQNFLDAQQQNDNAPTQRSHEEKSKLQIIPLGYFILDHLSSLNDKDLIDVGGFHKIYEISIPIEERKTLNLAYKTGSNDKLEKEIQFLNLLLSKSYSKYIVQIYIYQQFKNNYYFMENCHFKSLRNYQKKYQQVMSLNSKMKILRQIAKGLCHLHKRSVFHLDIKPDNILIDINGNVKICDFGEAYHPSYQYQRDSIKYSVPYSAPEILSHQYQNLSAKTDIFSFGVLAYELCFGKIPLYFLNKEEYLKKFKNNPSYDIEDENYGLLEAGPRTVIYHLIDLTYQCLKKKARERPSIQSIQNYLKFLKLKYSQKLDEQTFD
ncbi:unnamed protein product [Paramecium sonneborni]|uniref:Protein kinase domain-containing protein n=1 Tax=Paramecium sonneborni TaxID=65129 RepID=A0A8S1LD36_9CILI|nr:unnamed protein product [Paramecium sonneborni]